MGIKGPGGRRARQAPLQHVAAKPRRPPLCGTLAASMAATSSQAARSPIMIDACCIKASAGVHAATCRRMQSPAGSAGRYFLGCVRTFIHRLAIVRIVLCICCMGPLHVCGHGLQRHHAIMPAAAAHTAAAASIGTATAATRRRGGPAAPETVSGLKLRASFTSRHSYRGRPLARRMFLFT